MSSSSSLAEYLPSSDTPAVEPGSAIVRCQTPLSSDSPKTSASVLEDRDIVSSRADGLNVLIPGTFYFRLGEDFVEVLREYESQTSLFALNGPLEFAHRINSYALICVTRHEVRPVGERLEGVVHDLKQAALRRVAKGVADLFKDHH